MFRNLPVAVGMGTVAFRQVDRSIDEASCVLGAPALGTLRHVLLPLLRPALVDALIYGFVRSMTTVSGVVFLVTAETELATTFIITRVGQGDFSIAFAYCAVLVVLLSLFVATVHWLAGGVRLTRAVRGNELRGMRT
jgi:iron(III) transport system permease protein